MATQELSDLRTAYKHEVMEWLRGLGDSVPEHVRESASSELFGDFDALQDGKLCKWLNDEGGCYAAPLRVDAAMRALGLINTYVCIQPTSQLRQTAQSAQSVLDAAAKHMRDRAATYDKPEGERSMAKTVEVFNSFHGTALTEAQGWHFMQILKDVRLFARPGYHADSAEDGVAYGALKAEARAKEVQS